MQVDPNCVICGKEPESGDHLLFACFYLSFLCTYFKLKLQLQQGGLNGLLDERTYPQQAKFPKHIMLLVKIILGTILWSLWQEINKRNFEKEAWDKLKLKNMIEEHIRITAKQCLTIKKVTSMEKEIQGNWD